MSCQPSLGPGTPISTFRGGRYRAHECRISVPRERRLWREDEEEEEEGLSREGKGKEEEEEEEEMEEEE